jgi:signal peptidase I
MSWSEKISAGDWPATIQSVAGTVVIAVFVVTFLVQAFTIPSESMEQTLLIGDYLLVDKFCYGGSRAGTVLLPYRNVRRGDVIVFHYPVNPAQDFVKRVVALPGDRLRLINKRVYVNGSPVREPYAQYITRSATPTATIFRAPILPTTE